MKVPGRYRHPCRIAEGGMGEVYRATDSVLDRDVAIKLLAARYAADPDIRERFTREALAAARLSGEPNTVPVFDVGEIDGRPFIVMAHLGGGSLAARLGDGPVAHGQALFWLEQAARALDAAHGHGIVHRDVKPANLLLDDDGNIHVADFGIARAAGLDSNTQTGVVLGTFGYLAPEQATGHRATAASDGYALAVVAHELLAGARPGEHGARLPREARGVFARALAQRPEERYPSCLAFVAALRDALGGATAPTVVLPGTRRHRRRAAVLAAGLVALTLLGYVLASGLTASGGSPPPAPATRLIVRTVTVPAPVQPAQPVSDGPKGDHRGHDHGHDGGDGGD